MTTTAKPKPKPKPKSSGPSGMRGGPGRRTKRNIRLDDGRETPRDAKGRPLDYSVFDTPAKPEPGMRIIRLDDGREVVSRNRENTVRLERVVGVVYEGDNENDDTLPGQTAKERADQIDGIPPAMPPPQVRVVDDDAFLAKVKVITDAERAKKVAKEQIEAAAVAERTAAVAAVADTRRTRAVAAGIVAGSALDQAYTIIKDYVDMKEHEHVAVALWSLHTHVFDRFTHTPRLATLSPDPGAGKSTVFNIINQLCYRSEISGNITGPSLYRTIDQSEGTVLLDEGDRLNWQDKSLHAVVNDGHEPGRPIKRTIGNELRSFKSFAPLGLAAIGKFPLTLMRRAIVINMHPPLPLARLKLKKMEVGTSFDRTWLAITDWAQTVTLNLDPPLPPGTVLRIADNWRPLISIADSFSPAWGALARKSAITFQSLTNASVVILLLYDIRTVFNQTGLDIIGTEFLVRKLIELETSWTWGAYTGVGDDKPGRKLTAQEVSRLLRSLNLGIQSKSEWTEGPRATASSIKSYARAQFEDAWLRYCPDPNVIADETRPTEPWEELARELEG